MTRILGRLLFLLLVVPGCGREASAPSMADLDAEAAPVREHWGIHLYASENGVPRTQIMAPYMALYEDADSTYTLLRAPEGGRVTAHTFDASGAPSATITADELVIFESDDEYVARGDVVVTTETGRRLETEHLFWYETTRRLHTPGFVRLTTPMEQFQGYELDANEDLTDYRIKRLTGQMEVEE